MEKEATQLAPEAAGEQPPESEPRLRARDAHQTRQQLLLAARRRFAFDGYSATTVRDIAMDVGVNVALINRYFESKEGLFEACISSVGEQLKRPAADESTIAQITRGMVGQLVSSSPADDAAHLHLLLLLRSSGDPRAEEIRINIIKSFAERIATAAGWRSGDKHSERILLRAEIALSTTLGLLLLRSTGDLQPLASADEAELFEPLQEVMQALLSDL